MQLVFSAVQSAMSDSESVLSRAINAAFKVGVGVPARWLFGGVGPASGAPGELPVEDEEEPLELPPHPSPASAESEKASVGAGRDAQDG